MKECPKGFSRGNCPECTCVDGVLKATKKDKRNWKDRYDKYEDRMRFFVPELQEFCLKERHEEIEEMVREVQSGRTRKKNGSNTLRC